MGILQDLMGSSSKKASNLAAQDTYAKQQAATGELKDFAGTLPGRFNEVSGGFKPYIDAGGDALKRLMSGLSLGGNPEEFTAGYRSLPGYKSGLETGTDAVARGYNSGNMGQSGAAMKGLYKFGSDYEDRRSGDYIARLMALITGGQAATGAKAGVESTGIGTESGVRQSAFGGEMGSAGTIGQGLVAGEQAKQNALTNLLGVGTYLGGSYLGGPKKLFG